jgi:hypothetical protein
VILGAAVLAHSADANHSRTEWISQGPSGGNGQFHAYALSSAYLPRPTRTVSADGSRVFFTTDEGLVPEDTDSQDDVYERSGGLTRLLSTGPTGGNGSFPARADFVSEDGTRVRFWTEERLTADDTDSFGDLYERSGGTTTLVTRDTNERIGDNVLSKDGNVLVFMSNDRLTSADTDNALDIYRWSGEGIELVSLGTREDTRLPYFFGSRTTNVSADGSRVFFESAEPLDPADDDSCNHYPDNTCIDVYEYFHGAVRLISTGPRQGARYDQHIDFAGISEDGTRAWFVTAESLSPEDRDDGVCGYYDFSGIRHPSPCGDVYERRGDTTTLISQGPNDPIPFHMRFVAASPDGLHVVFHTEGPLTPDDTDVIRTCQPDGSCDYRYYKCVLRSCEDFYERFDGTTKLVSTGPADPQESRAYVVGSNPDFEGMTEDGSQIFFSTYVPLVAEDGDNCYDIYRRAGGATELISTGPADRRCPDVRSSVGFSDDGSRVFFSSGTRLVNEDDDPGCQYFDSDEFEYFSTPCFDVYERHAGMTTLISVGPNGGNGPYGSFFAGTSRDGRVVVFTSEEQLVSDDHDGLCGDPEDFFNPPTPCVDVYTRSVVPPDCS